MPVNREALGKLINKVDSTQGSVEARPSLLRAAERLANQDPVSPQQLKNLLWADQHLFLENHLGVLDLFEKLWNPPEHMDLWDSYAPGRGVVTQEEKVKAFVDKARALLPPLPLPVLKGHGDYTGEVIDSIYHGYKFFEPQNTATEVCFDLEATEQRPVEFAFISSGSLESFGFLNPEELLQVLRRGQTQPQPKATKPTITKVDFVDLVQPWVDKHFTKPGGKATCNYDFHDVYRGDDESADATHEFNLNQRMCGPCSRDFAILELSQELPLSYMLEDNDHRELDIASDGEEMCSLHRGFIPDDDALFKLPTEPSDTETYICISCAVRHHRGEIVA